MFRYLVVHLPCFRLERCGWQPDQLVALVTEEKNALRVQATTPAGHHRGVRVGMTAAEARARVPELQTEFLDPVGEAQDLEAVTQQLLRISPNLGSLPPDSMVAEISRSSAAAALRRAPPGRARGGLRHLAGGERAVMERVRLRMADLGHLVRVVVADDPRTAHAVARWSTEEGQGRSLRIRPGGGAEALSPLPLSALELPEREHQMLEGLGIRTVGDFAALAPAAVAGRLGPIAVAAHAMALGRCPADPLPLWESEDTRTLSRALPDAVTELEALLFVLNAMLRELSAHLAASGEAATRILVRFGIDTAYADGGSGQPWQDLALRLGQPTRDPGRMLSLLRLRLERFQLAGPVIRVVLELTETAPFTGRQRDLLGQEATGERVAEVATRLQDSLGSHAVIRPLIADRHRPEAAWVPQAFSPLSPTTSQGQRTLFAASTPQSGVAQAIADDPVTEWRGFPELVPPARPPLLLPEPLAIEVDATLGTPRGLHMDGRWFPATDCHGPEKLVGEWWFHGGFQRTYWRLRLRDGRTAWIYQEDRRWLLHGWWDR